MSRPGGGTEVPLEPRAMELLVALADRAGETVSKEELLDVVWRGAHVVESVVPKTVSVLRTALGDAADRPVYILTVPRRGYRLIAPVTPLDENTPGREPETQHAGTQAGTVAWTRRAPALAVLFSLLVVALSFWVRSRTDSAESRAWAGSIDTLAVAPFSRSRGDVQLATAFRSVILSDVSRLGHPKVISLPPDALEETDREVAGDLGADALLRGDVFDLGSQVRIDLQLVEVQSGLEVWSQRVERPVDDLLALRRQAASGLIERLGGDPIPAAAASVRPEVYRRYLEARLLWSRRGLADIRKARELFQSVAEEAPEFAEGLAWLAVADMTHANYFQANWRTLAADAARVSDRALQLAPQDPMSRIAAGLVALNVEKEPEVAVAHYRIAVQLAPNSAMSYQYLAEALSALGEHEDALTAAGVAVDLDPISPLYQAVRGVVLFHAGDWQEAIEALERALVLDPEFWWILRYRAFAQARLNRIDSAAEDLVELVRSAGHSEAGLARLQTEMKRDGLRGYFGWRLDLLEERRTAGHSVRPMEMAEALAGVGRDDEALESLQQAADAGLGEYFYHWRTSPAFDGLRNDPRFRRLYDTGL